MNLNPKTFGHASAVNRAGEIRTCIRGVESERGRAGGREGGREGREKRGRLWRVKGGEVFASRDLLVLVKGRDRPGRIGTIPLELYRTYFSVGA